MHEVGEAEIPAVLLAVAIVALVSLGIYHRAKAIAARNVEVRKLQRLAADEAAWVEAAAAEEYTSMLATSSSSANRNQSATTNPLSRWTITATNNTVERHPTAVDSSSQAAISLAVCVVCSTPTVKRCSQCKLVKYCSSKCQVQHWREGHKLECHVPKVSSTCKNKTLLAEASSQNKALLAEANSENTRNSGINNAETVLVSVQEKSAPAKTSRTLAVTALDGSLPKPNKILFPYEYFVKYFNWDRLPLSPCGLINCGNSCFANVVLQCLTYTRPLAAYLLQGSHTEECRRNDWCFMCELQSHVCRVKEGQNPFSPIRILSQIRNIGNHLGYGRQEDAHEFMRFAIDSMQSICLDEVGGEKAVDPRTQETTFIQHIFGGHLQSQVKCTECHHESDRYENMMDLAVEVQGNVESLEDALAQFTAPEWLDGENKYKCDRCNAYVKARKRLTVHEAPNILTIALKRYQSGKFGKLNKRVTFPEILDMSLYMSGKGDMPPHYHLYAVVVHVDMLNASFFGHYICYVKDLHGSWYKVDDSKVKEVDLEKVMQQKAYMLLYTRSAPRPAPEVDNGNGQSSSIASVNESCGVGNKTLLKGKDLRPLDVPVSSTLSNGVANANGKFPSFAGIHGLTDGEVSNSFTSSVRDSGPVVFNSTANSCQSASISNFDDMKNLATCSTSPSCHLLEIESSLKVITNHVNSPEVMSDSDYQPLGAFPETTGEWGEVHENTEKLKLYTALSPLPIPRPLGTDQLPAWPFASCKRASSCPALLNFSSEHGSSLISVSEICNSQRKLEGEVDTLNPVRHLHVSNLEGLDPGDVVMSSMHSQHKIGGDNETSELQHNLEEISCRSNVTQHSPPSEILMGKVSGITVSQLGKANLSVDIDSSYQEYDGNPIITNGHSVTPDEHRKLATSMMLNLGEVKGTGNSETANTPFLDTATVEDACNGVSFQMRAHHLHENGNGDCMQRKSVSKSESDACSTNSDASSLISVLESGYVPSQSESLQAPSQLSIPSVLEGRTCPRPPPLYTGSKFEKCSRESEDGISVLKPMFKPGFLNEASRRQFRFKAGDKKANANVISHILPNGRSNCGHGNSSHLPSTYSPLTMISDLVAVDTGVPCAAAYGEIQCNGATGSSDRVILRPITNNDGMIPRNSEQVIEVKSRHTDTKVTLNTCSSHASMEGKVQNGADAGTEKPLYKRERADTVDRLKDSQGAIDVANDHISTAVNGLSLTSEYTSQQSGLKTLESLTDESVGSLKNSMGNHTFVMNTRKEKVGRNDNCTCGSHQKWKKCCGRAEILGRHLVV